MDRNKIEEKDRRLVKKIRTIVEQKEKRTTRKKVFWKAPGIWLALIGIGLILFGLTVFRQPATTAVPDAADQTSTVGIEDTTAGVEKKASDESAAPIMEADAKDEATIDETDAPADSTPGDEPVESEAVSSISPVESDAPEVDVTTANADRAATTGTTAEAAVTPPPSPSSALHISHLVACGGVRDKQFVSAKSTFSLAADPFVMVWMRVLSKTPPYTLTHVYFVNGKHYCDVSLDIPYPHMRTWSKVTINRDIHIGRWHVDVVAENGEKLDQIEFTVVP